MARFPKDNGVLFFAFSANRLLVEKRLKATTHPTYPGEQESRGPGKNRGSKGVFTHASTTARRPFDKASGKYKKRAGTDDA